MDEIVYVSSPNQHYATGPECHTPDHTPTGPKPRPRKNKNQQHQARTRTCMMSGVRKPASSTFSTAVSSRSAACFLLLLDFSFVGFSRVWCLFYLFWFFVGGGVFFLLGLVGLGSVVGGIDKCRVAGVSRWWRPLADSIQNATSTVQYHPPIHIHPSV